MLSILTPFDTLFAQPRSQGLSSNLPGIEATRITLGYKQTHASTVKFYLSVFFVLVVVRFRIKGSALKF